MVGALREEKETQEKESRKIKVREKVEKSRNTFFQCFVALEGPKVGSLMQRVRSDFGQLRCWKSARRCGARHISTSKGEKYLASEALLDVQLSLFLAGARDSAPCQKWAKREGFVAVAKTMAGVGRLKRICTTLHYTPLHFTTLRYSTTTATAAIN